MCMCGAFIFANIKYIRILIWIIRSCNSNSQLTTVARSNPPALAPTKLQHTTREGAPFLTSQQAPNRHNRQSAQKTATMEGIDQETGESTGVGRSPRFTLWVAFLTFATITMAAAIEVKNDKDQADSNSRWLVAISAITLSVTAIITIMHLLPNFSHFIVNTKIEGVIIIVLSVGWAVTVSIVSNANSGLAVDNGAENTIINGNLYYFSWAGFVTSIVLVVAYLRGVFGVDVAGEIRSRSTRLTLWAGMLACALVVMGSSANVFDKFCSPQVETDAFCKRTKYGISVGVISTIFALAVVGFKMMTTVAPFMMEAGMAVFLAIMNGFGVAFITSAKGPGSPIGNLYYFTWFSFLCSLMLVAGCYEDYTASTGVVENVDENDLEMKENGDIAVESIEDSNI